MQEAIQSPEAAAAADTGPVLSANVPQSVSYSGQHYIELALPADWFVASAQIVPTTPGQES